MSEVAITPRSPRKTKPNQANSARPVATEARSTRAEISRPRLTEAAARSRVSARKPANEPAPEAPLRLPIASAASAEAQQQGDKGRGGEAQELAQQVLADRDRLGQGVEQLAALALAGDRRRAQASAP